jgi:predicted MPP superfamily phosphohydrolase
MPAAMIIGRLSGSAATRLLVWPAYVWMGLMFLLLFLLLGTDLVKLLALVGGVGRVPDPERRLALSRLVGTVVAVSAGGLGVLAMREALGRVAVRRLDIQLARLPAALDGIKIVQLTDIHIGPTLGRAFIEQLVATTNALAPDVVAITGDLVDGTVAELRDAVAPLRGLRAKHGVYFVTGNHEYYSGADEWIAELEQLGVHVLRNERVSIGDGDASFDLAGIDDHSAHAPGHAPDLSRAVAGRDPSRELVLLAHQPRAIKQAKEHGVGLQLSGHTHGGQIWPWRYFVYLQQPYVAGLVREGDTQLYVSCGTGYWGPPMRLGAPAEITELTLRATART